MRLVTRLRRRMARRRRALICRDAVELMTDFLEGSLTSPHRRRFEAHLAGCPACTAYLSQMQATVESLGRLEPERLPDAVLDELVEVYRRVRAG